MGVERMLRHPLTTRGIEQVQADEKAMIGEA